MVVIKILTGVLVGGCLVLGAAAVSAQGVQLQIGGTQLAQSSNAQMIADKVSQDLPALKAGCAQGAAGVTPLVQQAIGALMREGKRLNPGVDGPAAGQVLAQKCPTLR